MKIKFHEIAWNDYLNWRQTNKMTLRGINQLIRDIQREPFAGIGKPEPLKHQLTGQWSRRIDDENRLVYLVKDDAIVVVQCRGHYTTQ